MQATLKTFSLCVALWTSLVSADFQPEPIGKIEQLPANYPAHWVMVHDFSFFHMFEGEVLVVDPLASNGGQQYKGMMTASLIAAYQRGKARDEHYIIETFYSRGGRGGQRTDVVTIWDASSLTVKGEIVIPAKRVSGMPKTGMSALLDNERFLAVYNFTPGQSVSIVDLDKREFVAEVPTAGCGFIVPNGQRSFSSLCANGSMMTSELDKAGKLHDSHKTGVLFDPEDDPVFESFVQIKGMTYLPTFTGKILPLDTSGKRLAAKPAWWLTAEDERNWRPGGMNIIARDSSGVAYVLMNPEGGEGTHKDGGAEVWAYDLGKQQRLGRLALKNWGLSLGTSGTGDGRLLLVTNADMGIDVYRLADMTFVHTLQVEAATPFLVHGAH